MATVQGKRSWSEINKERKEHRKKLKEKKLAEKFQAQPTTDPPAENPAQQKPPTAPTKHLRTIAIAVPGSILENAQSFELRTYLAGQIARAACIFRVDEVVVFDDYADAADAKKGTLQDCVGLKNVRRCCVQLGRILQYLECPQYLRKFFFPIHDDLRCAGLLNPLDAPHHLRKDDEFVYR